MNNGVALTDQELDGANGRCDLALFASVLPTGPTQRHEVATVDLTFFAIFASLREHWERAGNNHSGATPAKRLLCPR